MGIPKFYRWLSERYPMINQLIADNAFLPEVDNLYLDMNGILHNCSHANDGEIAQKTDKDVLLAIFYYIDRIVHIVKPQKLLYMAIDGVAPRAKLNQQRSRRFRSAKDASVLLAEARARGENVDESKVFDSNCITPGTAWMARMSSMIKYFIRRKIKEDPLWQGMRVIFSGHEVPGEGEHKIIAYIRAMKMQRGYNPNTRHVMYGLDADLVMLSLLSHDPHFSLLREVVDFNSFSRKKNETKTLTKQIHHDAWQLLHISTVRHYLDNEFRSRGLAEKLPFGYDLERVIDDFILLCIFVGNDFLPHLPSLDIAESAIDFMFQIYCEELPGMGGYLTDQGKINVGRMERIFVRIGQREGDVFADRAADIQKMNRRAARGGKRRGGYSRPQIEAPEWLNAGVPNDDDDDDDAEESGKTRGEKSQGISSAPFKNAYYTEKFGIKTGVPDVPDDDKALHELIVKSYLTGLEWVLRYYYSGVCSWNWFYPFHYAPMASDMVGLSRLHAEVHFDLGEPFKPFEQLLGCLPPRSCTFLPKPYQLLMTTSTSPIKDFYPADFKIDMNGKRNPWEGVNLLSFINEDRLKDAIAKHAPDSSLSEEERKRNSFGNDLEYRYDASVMTPVEATHADKTAFPDIEACQSRVRVFRLPKIATAGGKFVPRLCRGVKIPYPSYPIVGSCMTGKYSLRALQVNVFGNGSRKETLALKIDRPTACEKALGISGPAERKAPELDFNGNPVKPSSIESEKSVAEIAAPKILGQVVHIEWPHTRPAVVEVVSDPSGEWRLDAKRKGASQKVVFRRHKGSAVDSWRQAAMGDWNGMLHGMQIPGKAGVDIGPVDCRVGVRALVGMRRDPATGAVSRLFNDTEDEREALTWCPLQTIILDKQHPAPDTRFDERGPAAVESLAKTGSSFIYLGTSPGKEAHGALGTVLKSWQDPSGGYMADVDLKVGPPEPPFGKLVAKTVKERHFSTKAASKALKISPSAFGRIVSTLKVRGFDIGLNLKVNNKGNYLYLPGYARPVTNSNGRKGGNKNNTVARGPAWNSSEETRERFLPSWSDEKGKASSSKENGETEERIIWEYSKDALQLIQLYQRKFPRVFQAINTSGHQRFSIRDVCTSDEQFDQLCLWLQQLRTYKLPLVPSGSLTLCRAAAQAVQTAADAQHAKAAKAIRTVRLTGVPLHLLYFGDFTGTANEGEVGAGTDQLLDWQLGDRVVNIRCGFVPFGLRGTIVATHPTTGTLEVVFDHSFIGGNTLHGLCKNGRGRVVRWTDLLAVDASNIVEPKSPAEIAEEKRKKEEEREALLAYNRQVAANQQEEKKRERLKKGADVRNNGKNQKTEADKAAAAARKAEKKAKKKADAQKDGKTKIVVKQLLKRPPMSSEKLHLQNLMKNAGVNKGSAAVKSASGTSSNKQKEVDHLHKLFSNATVESSAADKPMKASESAHLEKLLANAGAQPAQQPQSSPMMAMGPSTIGAMMPSSAVAPLMVPIIPAVVPIMPNMMMIPRSVMPFPAQMPRGSPVPGVGPMPTSASLGPMPTSESLTSEESASGTASIVSRETSSTSSSKKIPRQKKTSSTSKGVLMPAVLSRQTSK